MDGSATVSHTVSDYGSARADDVRVRVTDDDPSFGESSPSRSVPENSPANTAVGAPVTATDPDTASLSYTLAGADAASFAIDASSGQLRTAAGVTWDHEARSSYSVTVRATDGANGGSASAAVAG